MTMNKTAIIAIAVLFLFFGCKKNASESTDNHPIATPASPNVEGTVFYFVGGGTVEMIYPPGFRLQNYHWFNQNPDSALPVYVSGAIDSSYIDKFVRVYGTYRKTTMNGDLPGYSMSFTQFNADSLQVVN
jgi:hypothetical protein